ncbi:carboxypeptidase-like regulatory domain-containing protein [Chitinophaga filiformis]|uniref:Carboxypeptidase-like regulatory domain-containing protein n=1 Tax=Chitinophaga filiformis TaxID=104663 RepID=A0ABY4I1E0_CHIFI|nr:carboxypeptidase-like regulatory domain-containing protein [Chitinophaga filiformis]UPK69647.1 carboxypeptidase-like regulatory domain-containing protein [Chitinophaga filiformis]
MKNIIFLAFFLCLITACVKEGPPGPKGPDGPPYTWPPGNITGYIDLLTQAGWPFITRKDSVLLQITNIDSMITAYTDTTGYFHFDSIPPGNYDIRILKSGYDSLHLYVRHAGGAIDKFTGITFLSQQITTRLVSISSFTRHEYNTIRIGATVRFEWPVPSNTASASGFRFFLDTTAALGAGRLVNEVPSYRIRDINGVTGEAYGEFIISASGIPSGKQYYVTAAAAPPTRVQKTWLDYTNGMQIPYPYLGDSIKTTITYTE